jgi:hypothetical protein
MEEEIDRPSDWVIDIRMDLGFDQLDAVKYLGQGTEMGFES